MKDIVLVDIHNTLLDSRHRQCSNTFFISLINNDDVNYPVLKLINALRLQNYNIVFFAYCNFRAKQVVVDVLQKYGFSKDTYQLFVDINNKHVTNALTLKQYVLDNILKDESIAFAIDRDIDSINNYKQRGILTMVPHYE